MRRARTPATAKTFAQLHAYARITDQIADVSSLHAVLCHDPKLFADASVAHRSAACLPGLATGRLKQRISRRRDADRKEKLNRRVEHVFLQRVNNPMFHFIHGHTAAVYAFHCTILG